MSTAPRVFVSHASEDKQRFVIPFATALRKNGVEAWVGQWEILPGDSLVDKLFEEGLKSAAAVVVVISQHSVEKPWVREELNKAIVDRVTKQTKIIPIVIDECEVPEALKSTVWERVTDLKHFEPSLQRVMNAIFEKREKPPIGNRPAHFAHETISNLTAAETLIFKTAYDIAVADNTHIVRPDTVFDRIVGSGISQELFGEALIVLDENLYLHSKRTAKSKLAHVVFLVPTNFGFENYANEYLPEFDEWTKRIALQILNHAPKNNLEIAEALNIPIFVVDQILLGFNSKGWITLMSRGSYHLIMETSPSMKRNFS